MDLYHIIIPIWENMYHYNARTRTTQPRYQVRLTGSRYGAMNIKIYKVLGNQSQELVLKDKDLNNASSVQKIK